MPTQAEAERECEPTPSSPRTQRPLLDELDLDAHPLRVNVAYSSLVEHAVRRGDSIGYGVPEFVVNGYDDDLVSDASLSPPPSPAPVYRQEADEISQERIASAIEVAIQEKARRHSTAYAPFGSQSAVPRQGGRKHGAAKKTAARNAGQTSEPGLKRRSQAGFRARKKKRKQEEWVSLAQRPYDKVHDPSYYRRKFPVIAVSLKTLEVVYETVSSGYTAKVRPTKIRSRLWTEEDLRRAGAVHFPWDGKESVALIDASDICVGVLVAPPKDESFHNSGRAMADLIESQRSERPQAWTYAPGKKRGDFPSLSAGMNYNFHEARPKNRVLSEEQQAAVNILCDSPDGQRIAGHMSEVFAHYFPMAYEHTCDRMRELHDLLPDLKFPFPNCIYPSVTFNGGPQTATYEHADTSHNPGTPSMVFVCGNYKKEHARFIFHDLNLYVDFPPNCGILLSSAAVRHSNTALVDGETRYSIAMYMPGALIRYAAYGGNVGGIPAHQRAQLDDLHKETWTHQHARLSKLWELPADRERVRANEQARARARSA